MGIKIPHSILVSDLLAIEIKNFIPETNDGITSTLQCHVNHGPGWNVEFYNDNNNNNNNNKNNNRNIYTGENLFNAVGTVINKGPV